VETSNFGMVYDMGTCSDPIWKFDSGGTLPTQWDSLRTTGFHADPNLGSWLTGTTDSPIVVIDTCSGFTVWASKVSNPSAGILHSIGSIGAFEHASNGLDRRDTPYTNSTVNERSRGNIPDSMLIRKDLMDYGIANNTDLGHVLEIFWVETDDAAGHIHPMVGHESPRSGWGAEGWRLAIDPAVDLTTRACTPQALVIARTLQNFGGYIGDNSGGATAIKAEQDRTGSPVWNNTLQIDELAGCFTWDDMVVIQPGWDGAGS
jgi:hypothetical protein